MIADILALYDFLQKNADKLATLGAVFNDKGERLDGDAEVEIERIPTSTDDVWFYRAKPVDDYIFVPMPVVPCFIEYARPKGGVPQSDVFRFIPTELNAFSSGGNPNLAVGFSIIGYKPSQILDRMKTK